MKRKHLPQPSYVFLKSLSNPKERHVRLTSSYVLMCGPFKFCIKPGFIYDGASIPLVLRPFIGGPFDPLRLPAATVHDWLYASHALPRFMADLIFTILLMRNGFPIWRSLCDGFAVMQFGKSHWEKTKQTDCMHQRTFGTIYFCGYKLGEKK